MRELPDGWIPWHGGPCPVPLRSRPLVRFGDGFIRDKPTKGDTASRYIGIWDNWRWLVKLGLGTFEDGAFTANERGMAAVA